MPRIKWKGEDLGEWSGKPTLKESRLIKSELGIGPMEFQDKFEDMDPDAWAIFVAIMLTRSGKPTNFEDVDGEYDDLEVVVTEKAAARAKADAEEAGKAPSSASESGASDSNESDSSTNDSPTSTDS